MSLDLSASDINQLQGPSGQVPYAKAINALKKRFDILPTDRVKNASTKKKVKDRQAELLRTLRASGQDTLARQFAAAPAAVLLSSLRASDCASFTRRTKHSWKLTGC